MRSLLFVLLLLAGLGTAAQDSAYAAILARWQREHQFSGVALVAHKGRFVWAGSTGLSDRERKTTLRTTTPFRIASLTKTFTAVMILQLQEEGLLRLGDTIGKHLPGYKGPGRDQVTVRQLLTYSSGITDCEGGKGMEVYRKALPIDSFIARYCSGPLTFAPGTKSQYNNTDFILLGKIIENVTRRTYTDNLERRILRPLRLNGTGVLKDESPVTGLARSYSFKDSILGLVADPAYATGNFYASGSLYATAFDLMRFDAAIFTHQLLREGTVRDMIHGNEQLGNVGLGFWATKGWGAIQEPFVYRPGGILGSRANWIHLVDSGLTLIVLSNTDRGDLFRLSEELYRVSRKK